MPPKTTAIILAYTVVGWALCGATTDVGMAVTSPSTALIVHLVAAPVFFIVVSWVYFRWFSFTSPLQTAMAFTTVQVFNDPRF